MFNKILASDTKDLFNEVVTASLLQALTWWQYQNLLGTFMVQAKCIYNWSTKATYYKIKKQVIGIEVEGQHFLKFFLRLLICPTCGLGIGRPPAATQTASDPTEKIKHTKCNFIFLPVHVHPYLCQMASLEAVQLQKKTLVSFSRDMCLIRVTFLQTHALPDRLGFLVEKRSK